MYDFQKANMWKRISAAIFDFIILVIFIIGFAWGLSTVLKYDSYADKLQEQYTQFETQYGVSFDMSAEEFEALSMADKEKFYAAEKALTEDVEINNTYAMIFNLVLLIVTFSILLGYLCIEFITPLIFGNGQTLGKKIFGIGVMRVDGVKVTPMLMFIRTVLGKYTIETMIPVLVFIMFYFNVTNIISIAAVVILAIVQIVLLMATKARTPIHDKLAATVTVDFASQMIFDTPEELLAYKQKLHAETVNQTAS